MAASTARCILVAIVCLVWPAVGAGIFNNVTYPSTTLNEVPALDTQSVGTGEVRVPLCGANCAVCSSNGTCSACANKKYLDVVTGQCLTLCPLTHRAQGFGNIGRLCIPAKPVASRRNANSLETEPSQTAHSQDRTRGPRQAELLLRSRRLSTNCARYDFYFRWTGCNYGGCARGETETRNKYCFWKAVYDEQCRGINYDRCLTCNANYHLRIEGSAIRCDPCKRCSPNQFRTGSCANTAFTNFECTTCGTATITGKLGTLTAIQAYEENEVGRDINELYSNLRLILNLRTTSEQANAGNGFSDCLCPSNYERDGERGCKPVCRAGCSPTRGSCYNQSEFQSPQLCYCDYGWGGSNCDVRYVGNPYRHWCHASIGTSKLDQIFNYYFGCDCDTWAPLRAQGTTPYFARDPTLGFPNCGLLKIKPSMPLGFLKVAFDSEEHNALGVECDVTECDPLAPTISRLTSREISFFNYGKRGESMVISTNFRYSFPYASAFSEDVGGPDFGPMRHKTGITIAGFDMFAINSGTPRRFMTWSTIGCPSGTSLNPVESQGEQTCMYTGASRIIFAHNERFLLYYRVRAQGQVRIQTPTYGSIPMESRSIDIELNATERRSQVAITIDFTPPYHCSEDPPGARCSSSIAKLTMTCLGMQEKVSHLSSGFAFSAQGWKTPSVDMTPGVDPFREAPIQMIMLTVFTMKNKGTSLIETDEAEVLDEYKVHYYQDDVHTARNSSRCAPPLNCDQNVFGMSFDNPRTNNMILPLPVVALSRLLSNRIDRAHGNAVRATLIAAVLTVKDLAGNSIKTRTTALFAPVGYSPAAITVPSGVFLSLPLAVPRELRNLLRPPQGGVPYDAPYVWQATGDSMEVTWFNIFANDWMASFVLKQLHPQANAPGTYDPDIMTWALPHKRGIVLYQWKIVFTTSTAEVTRNTRSPIPNYRNVDQSAAPAGTRLERAVHASGYRLLLAFSDKFRFETSSSVCTVNSAQQTTCTRRLELYDQLSYFEQSHHDLQFTVTDGTGISKMTATFRALVVMVNTPPYDPVFVGGTLPEMAPAGTLVGTLYVHDRESGDPTRSLACSTARCPCTLVAGSSGAFSIVNNELRLLNGSLSFASWKPSDTEIQVRCADDASPALVSQTARFSIVLFPVNKAPTAILPTNVEAQEDLVGGSLLTLLSSVDPDGSSQFNYTIVGDPSGLFEIANNQLKLAAGAVLDSRGVTTYTISVRTTDDGKAFPTDTTISPKSFVGIITIRVTEAAWPPTDILLNGANMLTIREDATVVGALTAVDRNRENTFVFEILESLGPGFFFTLDPLNNSRIIVGDKSISGPLDGLAYPRINISVVVRDVAARYTSPPKIFTISIEVQLGECKPLAKNFSIGEDAGPGQFVGALSASTRTASVSTPGALSIVSGGELFEIRDVVDNTTDTPAVTYELVVRTDVGNFPFDVTLVSRYAVQVRCNNDPPVTIFVEVTEANVPPDEIQFLPAEPLYDDSPAGTLVGFLRGKDHNTWSLGGNTFVSITPCVAPFSSNTPPGVNSSIISVLPINCSSDADDADGFLRLEVIPQNLTVFNAILSARDLTYNSSALQSVPVSLANLSFADTNVTYRLVVARDLWTLRQSSLIVFSAVTFDFESLIIDTVPRQVYAQFNVPVQRRPRITSVINSTIYFNRATTYPLVLFGGFDLSEQEMLKLVDVTKDCGDPGDASRRIAGPYTTQDGGPQTLLNPFPANGARVSLIAAQLAFLSTGSGHICFRYQNSSVPSSTNGWRRIGSWAVDRDTYKLTTAAPLSIADVTVTVVQTSAVEHGESVTRYNNTFTAERLIITIFDPFVSFARRSVDGPYRPSNIPTLSVPARSSAPLTQLFSVALSTLTYEPYAAIGSSVAFVLPVGAFSVFPADLTCNIVHSSTNVLAIKETHLYALRPLPAQGALALSVLCHAANAVPSTVNATFTLAPPPAPWPWPGTLELSVVGMSSAGSLAVSEKTEAGTLVGNVVVQDTLAPQRPVTLSALEIADDSCGLFVLSDDDATLVTRVPLDYETTHALCTLTLRGTAESENCDARLVVSVFDVVLLDENEPPAVNAAVSELADNSAAGTLAAAINVFDEDAGQSVSCTMSASSLFVFDPFTLVISVAENATLFPGTYGVMVTCTDSGALPLSTTVSVELRVLRANRPPGRALLAPLARLGRNKKWLYMNDDHAFAALDATDPDGHQDIRRMDLIDSGAGAFVLEQGMLRVGQYGDPVAFLNETQYSFVIRVTDRSGLFTDTRFVLTFEEGGETSVVASPARRAATEETDDDAVYQTLEAHYALRLPAKFFNDSFVRNRPKMSDSNEVRRSVTVATQGSLTLTVSVASFAEDIEAPAMVATVTVFDSARANFGLGMLSGHEYNVFVRAHDVAAVGPYTNRWETPGWPESSGLLFSNEHTRELTQLVRIDLTPPEVFDLYIIKTYDGRDERVPVIMGGDPWLEKLRLSTVVGAGEGFTFISDPNLANMRIGYGLYDKESGLRYIRYAFRETTFAPDYSNYQRTFANDTYAILSGQWNILTDFDGKAIRPLAVGSPACDPTSFNYTVPGHYANCTSGVAALCQPVAARRCFCLAYGHNDQCYINYDSQLFGRAVTPIEGDPASGVVRDNRFLYWDKFEMTLAFTITNYAMLSTSLDLNIRIDQTPPTSGFVVDAASPEAYDIDFMEPDGELVVSWSNFTDHESGIAFYEYYFGPACVTPEMYCGSPACVVPGSGACVSSPVCDAAINQSLVNAFRATRGMYTSASFTGALRAGKYHATVVAYNHALTRSLFVCSDGVVVDETKPDIADVRAEGVVIQPGLIKHVAGGVTRMWVLSEDGVKHAVSDLSCAANALSIPSPEAFIDPSYVANYSEFTPLVTPHTGTHGFTVAHGFVEQRSSPLKRINTTGACSRYGRAALMQYTESIGLQWNGGDAESGIADYEVAVCAYVSPDGSTDDNGALLVPESTHKQNYFVTVREGAIDDEPRIYYRIRAINRAQAIASVYLGPITVDAAPPIPFAPASSITFAPNSTHFVANWPAALFQTSPSGLCRIDVCFGERPGSCSAVSWLPAMPTDSSGCNSRPSMPRAAILSRSLLGGLQDGHTYFLTIRATSGARVPGFLLGPSFVHISTLASKGLVCDVAARQTARPLQLNDDVDYQSNTSVLSVQWDRFAHAFDTSITYQAALLYDGQLVGGWSASTSDLFTTLSLSALSPRVLPLHNIAARVRACNVMGCIESQSDGVLIVPLGPSTGRVNQGPNCSKAANLVVNGDLADPMKVFEGLSPAVISSASLGTLFQRGAAVVALSNIREGINALQLGTSARLETVVGTVEGLPYTISLDATNVASGVSTLFLEVTVSSRAVAAAGPELLLHAWTPTVREHFRQADDTWMPLSFSFYAVGPFSIVRVRLLDSPPALIDNIEVTQCVSNPASQASSAVVSMHWTDLPGPRQFVSEYQWAVIAGPRPTAAMLADGGAGIPQDRFLVPFTSAGLRTEASARVALPPLTTVYYAVRACYPVPAGCLDPVISDGLGIDSVPPLARPPSARYSEEGSTVRVTASWPHFQELAVVEGARTNQTVQLYQWALAAGTTERLFVPWQPITPAIEFASPGITWNSTAVSINVVFAPAILPSKVQDHTPPRFLLRAFSSEGIATSVSVQARTGFRNNRVVLDVDRFDITAVNENTIGVMDVRDLDVSRANDRMAAVWFQSGLFAEGFTTIEKPVFDWWIATDRTPQDCNGASVLRCGTTTDNAVLVTGLALAEGARYYLCIRIVAATGLGGGSVPPEAAEKMQSWHACSDGVTIDNTPPRPALVRFGALGMEGTGFSSSRQELSVIWGNFADIEEMGTEFYTTGIDYYEVAIGSHPGGEEIVRRHVVGDAHSFRALNLSLADGTTYYATVWATDMAAWETSVTSHGVTIDSTPPVAGLVYEGDDPLASFQSAVRTVTAHWSGFSDAESSVVRYEWAIGTSAGGTELMPWAVPQSDTEALYNLPSDLDEGQTIFVTVRATNGAGLHTTVTGLGVAIDYTPPTGGSVHDGAGTRDIDFQASRLTVGANWGGFSDAQSGIQYYRWAAGRAPGEDDVHPFTTVGLATSVSGAAHGLRDGLTVYVTVEACNYAGLCVQRTSDGVTIDASPPVVGLVLDGYTGLDAAFSPMPKTFALHWFDFYDPDSGLAQFEWCAGRSPGACDEIDWQPAFLEQRAFGTRADRAYLDNSTTLYGSVRVTNKAGLQAVKSSNGVRIDVTPPVPLVVPQFQLDFIGGIRVQIPDMVARYQPFLSVLRGVWQYSDPESAVHHLTWSARVHHDYQGQQPVNSAYLTDANEGIQANIQLADGDKYFLSVHACNGARMCLLQDEINFVFVDSSPPSRGTISDDMTWAANSNAATIRWYGFHDSHSAMVRYYVTLNGKQQSVSAVAANDATVYSTTFNPADLVEGRLYRVVIRGTNRAGLSTAIEAVVEAHASGQLNMVHEACQTRTLCQRQYQTSTINASNGCLPGQGGDPRSCQCSFSNPFCIDASVDRASPPADAWANMLLAVNDGFQQDVDIDFQPFINVLGATWKILTPAHANAVLRYDWTVGIDADTPYPGMGFFATNEAWFPVGLSTHGIFTVPGFDHTQVAPLRSDTRYFFYVRAWLSNKHFRIFRSDGVTVRNRGPQLKFNPRVLDGLAVRNPDYWNGSVPVASTVHVHPFVDLEYQPHGRSLAATWSWVSLSGTDGMFTAAEKASIARFEWAAGTYPGSTNAKSFATPANDTAGQDVYALPAGRSLASGVRYFTSVRASDIYGLFTELTSNGVTVDLSKPLAGSVYDGVNLKEHNVQSSTTTVTASWIGFRDFESGIVSYEVALSTSPLTSAVTVNEADFQYIRLVPSDPTVRFVNVGLHLSATLPISIWPSIQLTHGRRYFVFVRAFNGAGYASDVAVSDGFVIDQTPPTIVVCTPSLDNLIADSSFEQPSVGVWVTSGGPAPLVAASTSRIDTPDKSATFVSLATSRSVVAQNVVTVAGTRYRLSFSAAGYPRGAIQGQAGRVRAGDWEATFLLSAGQTNGFWRVFNYEFEASANVTLVQFQSLANGFDKLLAIDEVRMYACTQSSALAELPQTIRLRSGREFAALDGRAASERSLSCQSQFLPLPPGWIVAADDTVSRRVAAESFWGAACVVLDSGLSYFTLSRGLVAGTRCGTCAGNSCLLVAAQTQQLRPSDCTSVSRVVLIERLDAIHVGQPYQNAQSHLQASWIIADPESGVRSFEWAIGTVPGGTQLQRFTSVGREMGGSAHGLALHHGMQVYVTVAATNNVGVTKRFVSNPVSIDHTPPIAAFVKEVDVGTSDSGPDVDLTVNHTTVRVVWSFADEESLVQWCDVGLGTAPGTTDVRAFMPAMAGSEVASAMTLTGLNLSHGVTYYATVKCANLADLVTHASSDGITVLSRPPAVSEAMIVFKTAPPMLHPAWGPYTAQTDEIAFFWDGFEHVLDTLRFEFFFAESCVNKSQGCPAGTYFDANETDPGARCRPCGEGCALCTGPTSTECQACKLGYRFDGRACYLRTCPVGFQEDLSSSTCWRTTREAKVNLRLDNFPLQHGCTYEARVRGYYAFGNAPRGGIVTVSTTVDSTPPVVYASDLVVSIVNGTALIDWAAAVEEDVSPFSTFFAVGSKTSGRWDIRSWSPTEQAVFTFASPRFIVGQRYTIGLRCINAAGAASSVVVETVALERLP